MKTKHKGRHLKMVRPEDVLKRVPSARPRENLMDGVPVTNWFKGTKDEAMDYFTVQVVQLADGGCPRENWKWENSERHGWRIIRTDMERSVRCGLSLIRQKGDAEKT